MEGTQQNYLHPIRDAIAAAEVLKHIGESYKVHICSGRRDNGLVYPRGTTSLAKGLIQILKWEPDVVFVLGDGYENDGEGRFREVLTIARERLGILTPIYHINPVQAIEAGEGAKRLADGVEVLKMASPESFGLALLDQVLTNAPIQAIQGIVGHTVAQMKGTRLGLLPEPRKSERKLPVSN
jgi:hypothetical protein